MSDQPQPEPEAPVPDETPATPQPPERAPEGCPPAEDGDQGEDE